MLLLLSEKKQTAVSIPGGYMVGMPVAFRRSEPPPADMEAARIRRCQSYSHKELNSAITT